uniref:Thioredoxin domain-containing protein n=1 Tax=viral metagenome TaxID=1070528 RepID=A0A6C0LZ99_9ZZZZ
MAVFDPRYVTELAPSDFDDRMRTKPSECSFVVFYAPWCPHCHSIAPIWNDMGKLARKDTSFGVYSLNGDKYKSFVKLLSKKVEITGFPTILIFKGDDIHVYNDDRTITALMNKCSKICKGKR